VLYKSHYQLTM